MRLNRLTKTLVSIFSFTLIGLLALNSLNAATNQGTSGLFSSSATVDVNVSTRDQIVLYGLNTVNFGAWNLGDGNLANTQKVCVGRTGLAQGGRQPIYVIQASGDGNATDPSAFTLSNGVDELNYTVHWTDQVGQQTQLAPGSAYYNQRGTRYSMFWNMREFRRNGTSCGQGRTVRNADLEIRIGSTELSATSVGYYSGTVTLLVIPN